MIFSDTTNRTGVVQLLEDLTTTQSAASSSYPLSVKTRDINNAYAEYFLLAVQSSGSWLADDTNQTDYPIITANLVANQQDYTFTVDGSVTPNQILDIYRVEIKDASGNWVLIKSYDENDETTALSQQATQSGTPTRYSKTANGIFLDSKPSYASTGGLKIWFARTPSYFLSTDTTKKPGIPDVFHRYLAIHPAYFYCLQKGLPQSVAYFNEKTKLEKQIETYYSQRNKDEKPRLTVTQRSCR